MPLGHKVAWAGAGRTARLFSLAGIGRNQDANPEETRSARSITGLASPFPPLGPSGPS